MPTLDYIECYHHHHQLIKVITKIIKMSCVLILIQCRTHFGDIGGSVWVRARAASSKETVSSVPAWFQADSGMNLIKQGGIVTG